MALALHTLPEQLHYFSGRWRPHRSLQGRKGEGRVRGGGEGRVRGGGEGRVRGGGGGADCPCYVVLQ